MPRKDCPRSSVFPKGCKHWKPDAKHKFHGEGSCSFDLTEYSSEGYGPFLKDIGCNRLGTYLHDDKYEPNKNASDVAKNVDWDKLAQDYLGKPYTHEKWAEIRLEFFQACADKLSRLVSVKKLSAKWEKEKLNG